MEGSGGRTPEPLLLFIAGLGMAGLVGVSLGRWWASHRFCLSALLAEVEALQAGSPTAFRLWYLFGARLSASWRGQGMVFRLGRGESLSLGEAVVSLLWVGGLRITQRGGRR